MVLGDSVKEDASDLEGVNALWFCFRLVCNNDYQPFLFMYFYLYSSIFTCNIKFKSGLYFQTYLKYCNDEFFLAQIKICMSYSFVSLCKMKTVRLF